METREEINTGAAARNPQEQQPGVTQKPEKKGQEWFNNEYKDKEEIKVDSSRRTNFLRLDFLNLFTEKLDVIGSLKIDGKTFTKLGSVSLKKLRLFRLKINDCSRLNKIELSELDKLTSLEVINCPQLDKIELNELGKFASLEISDCSKLNKITNLSKFDKLTSLSVRGCPEIGTLNCLPTGLEELEVSDLIALDCSNTSVKELSLNLCPKIKILNCSNNNKLISLDISNCTELKFLNCTGSRLTSLDLAGCLSLLEELNKTEESASTNFTYPSDLKIIKERRNKNVLIVGRTGGGKSTLANVLTGTDDFKESAYAVSETKNFKKKGFENHGHYCVVDTIGVGDTKLNIKNVLYKIADGILSMPEGISQVLFVIDGRFTDEEIETFNLVKNSIFELGILKYVTIVRTKFTNFRSEKECEIDKKKMREENELIANIIASCKDVIHVDNPPINLTDDDSDYEDQFKINNNTRRRSRKILLNHLKKVYDDNQKSQEYFKLKNWDELHEKITKYIEENKFEELENDQELQAIIDVSKAFCLIQ